MERNSKYTGGKKMTELKLDTHELKVVGKNKISIQRTTIEEYDVEEYLRVIFQLKQQKIKLQREIKHPNEKIIKEIKAQKKTQLFDVKKVLNGISQLEKEAETMRANEISA